MHVHAATFLLHGWQGDRGAGLQAKDVKLSYFRYLRVDPLA